MIYMEKSKSFFNRFYPNYVFESVEKIPYEVLEKEKIKLIIFDMDNTLVDNKYTYTEELKEWMQHIKDKGVKLYILSNSPMEKKVKRISNELGIKYIYNAKKPFLKGFKAVVENSKVKKKNVMMIGDGINDSPALVNASIGVSMNSGTDIAASSSSVILMNDNLESILTLIKISDRTIKNIKENLFWAFFYNILMIPIAAGLLIPFKIKLNPMIASLSMMISSLTVVINSLRLKNVK